MQLGLIVNNDWQNTSDVTRLFARGKKKKSGEQLLLGQERFQRLVVSKVGVGIPLGGMELMQG